MNVRLKTRFLFVKTESVLLIFIGENSVEVMLVPLRKDSQFGPAQPQTDHPNISLLLPLQ